MRIEPVFNVDKINLIHGAVCYKSNDGNIVISFYADLPFHEGEQGYDVKDESASEIVIDRGTIPFVKRIYSNTIVVNNKTAKDIVHILNTAVSEDADGSK
jgi:hypothetical protein